MPLLEKEQYNLLDKVGTVDDTLFQYLCTTFDGSIDDMFLDFLNNKGFTGSISDMLGAWDGTFEAIEFDAPLTVASSAAVSTVVAQASVVGQDGPHTFTLTDDASGQFAITTGGELSVNGVLTSGTQNITINADNGVDPDVTLDTSVFVSGIESLLANSLSSSSSVSLPTVVAFNILNSNDLSSVSGVSNPTLVTNTSILAEDLSSLSTVSSPSVGQIHAVLAEDLSSVSSVSSPGATSSNEKVLLAEDVESVSETSTPSIAQTNVLLANDISSISTTEEVAVSQTNILTTVDISSTSNVTTPAVTHFLEMSAEDISSTSNVTTPTLTHVTGVSSLQDLADDIFVGGRTGILIAPGENDYQETGSQTTASALDDPVGSIVSLDPTGTVVTAASDSTRPLLGSDHYVFDGTDDGLDLFTSSGTVFYTAAMAIKAETGDTRSMLLNVNGNGGYAGCYQNGSSSVISGGTGTPTVTVDGTEPADRDAMHTAMTADAWVFVLITDFKTTSDDVGFSAYSNGFVIDGKLGPLLMVDDTLTAQELIDVEAAIMGAVS